MSLEHFFGQVVGESYRNDDGSSRQAMIVRCRVGELLVLQHEPDNPHDINAIRVLRQTGEQIGYLEREFAGEVVSRTAKGRHYHAVVAGVGRPRRSRFYGAALLIVVENDGASDAEIMAYAHEVLSRDRRVGVTVSEGSSRSGVVDWLLIGTIVTVVLALIAVLASR